MDDLDDLDELDIELRDADDIGSRLILLSAEVLWPRLTEPGDRREWFSWLKQHGIVAITEDWELDLLKSRDPDEDELSAAAAESIIPLAWAVGLIDELPARSRTEVVETILERLPVPPEPILPFLDGLTLLDENTIVIERERAEIWNWRVSAEEMRRVLHGMPLIELTEMINEVVLEAAAALVVPDNDGADLLLDGVPVKSLDIELVDWLMMATEERLRAFNWICGLTEWDQIDIDD